MPKYKSPLPTRKTTDPAIGPKLRVQTIFSNDQNLHQIEGKTPILSSIPGSSRLREQAGPPISTTQAHPETTTPGLNALILQENTEIQIMTNNQRQQQPEEFGQSAAPKLNYIHNKRGLGFGQARYNV